MKPIGKVLCATGAVARLIAFFWKDDFNPASAGIGEQIAYHYARFGAEIVLTDIREAVLQKVVEKCLTLGAKKIFYIAADMSFPSEPEKMVQFAVQKLGKHPEHLFGFQVSPIDGQGMGPLCDCVTAFSAVQGGLDYLVLNHASTNCFQEWAGDVEYTCWLMPVNFFSYVALATAALPTLEKNRGALVVVSSLTGKMPTPFTTYSATKFALDGFFSSLCHELIMQKKDVSVTLCILGLIDTESALECTRYVFLRRNASLLENMPKYAQQLSPRGWAKCSSASPLLAIVRGGATRAHGIFYPRWLQQLRCLWALFPSSGNSVLRTFYNCSSP
ncbi:Hydroxysteroid 11-beta-dehydrogenase 1-like protein [Lonchura striata]|uniref:Hydroxysteroid 11-beta-dehydrogenase 1-like protein n=1 Tax=Lonchura striata TaxID=40157 RepID=A0A218UFI3_9PASE|nr:Hydroxysteroid 11-beta-dehydrogenase 1-like protein [Lonchura striata domestica]